MGEPLRQEHRESPAGPGRPERRWVVDGRDDCDHAQADAVPLGLGGVYAYEACRRCGGVVVSDPGGDAGGKG